MSRNTIRGRFPPEFWPVRGSYQTIGSVKAGEAIAAGAKRKVSDIISEDTTPRIKVVHETGALPALIGGNHL